MKVKARDCPHDNTLPLLLYFYPEEENIMFIDILLVSVVPIWTTTTWQLTMRGVFVSAGYLDFYSSDVVVLPISFFLNKLIKYYLRGIYVRKIHS